MITSKRSSVSWKLKHQLNNVVHLKMNIRIFQYDYFPPLKFDTVLGKIRRSSIYAKWFFLYHENMHCTMLRPDVHIKMTTLGNVFIKPLCYWFYHILQLDLSNRVSLQKNTGFNQKENISGHNMNNWNKVEMARNSHDISYCENQPQSSCIVSNTENSSMKLSYRPIF